MKTGSFCAFLALILALVSACGTKTKGSGNLDTVIETRADSIPIHEILQPCFLLERASWNAVGDKAVIMNSGSNDSLVYVYRLPDFEFLYAGIRRGNGRKTFAVGRIRSFLVMIPYFFFGIQAVVEDTPHSPIRDLS